MLIAPIFHNNYLTTKEQSENQNVLTPNNHNKTDSNDNSSTTVTTTSRYNIFKTAINRGTELIRSTFLSKTNYSDSFESNSSPSTSVATTTTTTRNSVKIEPQNDESSSSSDSSSSSPDSIQNDLMYFKPINRELQTPLSSTKIIRIPSIRSTSSSSTTVVMQSPCPSPFFIPVSSQRHSAFSFVFQNNLKAATSYNDTDTNKSKTIKRKYKTNSEKHLSKNQKINVVTGQDKIIKVDKKIKKKTEDSRETRSKKRIKIQESAKSMKQKEFKSPSKVSSKSHTKKNYSVLTTADENEFRRITRSMKN
ncbi:hypothetical protein PVAND_011779 [Polypedilum vanderplanki]|uniref:Uncharacterized protein n=1 Tax=Polypedilum vanderplanki TaxID=319348 RepID=A0A9J6CJN9_POLVA|nr:hypothetical protein PVAND_011779 [Polypedilum vanderplanki]